MGKESNREESSDGKAVSKCLRQRRYDCGAGWGWRREGNSGTDLDQVTRKVVETGEIYLDIEYLYRGEPGVIEMPLGDMNRSGILKYQKYGLGVSDMNKDQILKHLINEEAEAPMVSSHVSVGWDEVNDAYVFKHHKGYGLNSCYVGNLAIKPKGSYGNWLEMVEAQVLGHVPLELALVMGFSAPLVGLIGRDVGAEQLIIHLFGDSSVGKTTATRLAISTFGSPDEGEHGLFGTWNATDNAIAAKVRGNNGLPVALDEASMSNCRDFSAIIYRLHMGKDKDRLDKNSELKENGTWSTTIISNGEHSLVGHSLQNTGLRVRVQEFGNVPWTRTASQAETINRIVLNNYGQAGPRFADALRQMGSESVLQRFREVRDNWLTNLGTKDKLSTRISAAMAMLVTTASLANELLGFHLDVDGIQAYLMQVEANSVGERQLAERAYAYVVDQFNQHRNCFNMYDEDEGSQISAGMADIWERCRVRDGEVFEIELISEKLRSALREGGFEDPNTVLAQWKQRNMIDCDADRYTRKRKVHSDQAT